MRGRAVTGGLLGERRGAALVCGLFFAVFLLACVYGLYDTAETVLYRQRVQDAADAAVFSSAVVQARGMNLIALLNMTMAVVLSIYVGLRLAQTLGYIAIGICLALSPVTWGATAVAVPPIEAVVEGLATAASAAKEPIDLLLSALHAVGKATSMLVPLGANLQVIPLVASHYDAFGVAVPGRLMLPIEDDRASVLCTHAGKLAGDLALAPIASLLPKRVERAMAKVVGKLAAAGEDWFCGVEGAAAPDLNPDDDTRWRELPRFPAQAACEQGTKAAQSGVSPGPQHEESCRRANVQLLASVPDRHGRCREGEPLCPSDCDGAARERCPPDGFEACTPALAEQVERDAAALLGSARVSCDDESPYRKRLAIARAQCLPESEAGRAGLGGYVWLEREVVRTYVWDAPAARWVEDLAARTEEPLRQVRREDGDRAIPCGRGGLVGDAYVRDPRRPVCTSSPRCDGPTRLREPGPCLREPPARGAARRFVERETEVTDLVRCTYSEETPRVETPDIDLTEEFLARSSFRLQEGVMLGASDFQQRALAIAHRPPSPRHRIVAFAAHKRREEPALMDVFGRFGLAQAEYYFDVALLRSDQTDAGDVTEWLWNMGWRARLRPFRILHVPADPHDRASGRQKGPSSTGSLRRAEVSFDCRRLPRGAESLCDEARHLLELVSEEPP